MFFAAIAPSIAHAAANTWVVNSAADTQGACTPMVCTLRSAIVAANSSTGDDLITFDIQPPGPYTISVGAGAANGLPAITDNGVTIDATTQPGGGAHGIRLDDPDVGGGESGLVLQGQNEAVQGFAITRFDSFGILINNGSAGNTITGNWIGTADGVTALGTGAAGIYTDGGGSNTIANNVVSGASNGSDGIDLHNSNNNVVTGNYVGMTADGLSRLPNADSGIEINGTSQGNRVGGLTAAERNVISGNSGIGMQLLGIMNADGTCSAPQNNVIEGNYLGVNAAGKRPTPYGNQGAGLEMGVCAQNNTVGGTAAGAANVASGNHDDGIQLDGATGPAGPTNVCNNTIQGNIAGLDPTASATRPNTDDGIDLDRGACNNLVGGTATGARNIMAGNQNDGIDLHERNAAGAGTTGNSVVGNLVGIAGNGTTAIPNLQNGVHLRFTAQNNTVSQNVIAGNGYSGVMVESASTRSNTITGNKIGTLADGTTLRGNSQYGVYVTLSANQNRIDSNTIAGNALAGVAIEQQNGSTTQRNTITRNLISQNGGLGIDLLPTTGVNPNDGTTSPSVGNIGLDFPVINQATTSSAKGTAPAGSTVEVFTAQPGAGETNGEGAVYLGTTKASTTGAWCLDGLSSSGPITATATDASGNTSEFSANVSPSGSLSLCATPPTNTAPPAISGTPQAGQVVTASTGTWSGSQPISYTYQWRRCDSSGANCVDITGATSSSYTIVSADVGSTLRVVVTASNSAGSSSATSAATAVVTGASSGDTTPPTIGTLSAPTSVTDTSFSLSWTAATDNSGTISDYRLDVATNSGFTNFVSGYQDRDVGTALSTTVTGLTAGTTYWTRVRAVDPSGNVSADSNVVSATTMWVFDAFARSVSGGWGSIDGFNWTIDSGFAADYSVDGAEGVIAESSVGSRNAWLALGRRDVSVAVKFRLTSLPTAGWQGVYALARVGSAISWYSLRVRSVAGAGDDLEFDENSSTTGLIKVGSGAVVPELAANTWYWLRLQAVGDGTTTTLQGKIWADGSPEPGTWTITATDTTPSLQGAAGAGVRVTSSSTSQTATLQVDTFTTAPAP